MRKLFSVFVYCTVWWCVQAQCEDITKLVDAIQYNSNTLLGEKHVKVESFWGSTTESVYYTPAYSFKNYEGTGYQDDNLGTYLAYKILEDEENEAKANAAVEELLELIEGCLPDGFYTMVIWSGCGKLFPAASSKGSRILFIWHDT